MRLPRYLTVCLEKGQVIVAVILAGVKDSNSIRTIESDEDLQTILHYIRHMAGCYQMHRCQHRDLGPVREVRMSSARDHESDGQRRALHL